MSIIDNPGQYIDFILGALTQKEFPVHIKFKRGYFNGYLYRTLTKDNTYIYSVSLRDNGQAMALSFQSEDVSEIITKNWETNLSFAIHLRD